MNVIITGASRGLGRSIAEIFAENGHNLYLTAMHEVRLYKATEELLKTLFEAHGEVVSVRIVTDPITGKSRGFAFVEMADAEAAKK